MKGERMTKSFPLTAILIGAGNRGMTTYGTFALEHEEQLNFVAVAEPNELRRDKFARLHEIGAEDCYHDWQEILSQDKMADLAFICTQDQMHTEPTIKALKKGYDVLLEKPMAHTLEDNVKIVQAVEETGRMLGVGHVLRYTEFFSTIREAIKDGLLGDIITITHRENVSYFHMAHSFVRGNWNRRDKASPMILAKCCHDLDLLYWLVDSLPRKISSFGSLRHFTEKNAPEGAPEYCVEGCPHQEECQYHAPRIYVEITPILHTAEKSDNKLFKFFARMRRKHPKRVEFLSHLIKPLKELRYWEKWPVEPLYHGHEEDYSDEAKMEILKKSPYGRCVYHCDNDVVDHQMVAIEFENGVVANLTMQGFSENEGRTLRIDGTKATLKGWFMGSGQKIVLYDHLSGTERVLFEQKLSLSMAQHGGGDPRFIDNFLTSVVEQTLNPMTSARASLESHLMAFAAEKSRLEGIVVDMKEFRQEL